MVLRGVQMNYMWYIAFPGPRVLLNNEFPDIIQDQPDILKHLVTRLIKPAPNSPEDMYLNNTIEYVKKKAAQSAKKVKLYNTNVGKKLYYVNMTIPPHTDEILCLIDTGASNSLLHSIKLSRDDEICAKCNSLASFSH